MINVTAKFTTVGAVAPTGQSNVLTSNTQPTTVMLVRLAFVASPITSGLATSRPVRRQEASFVSTGNPILADGSVYSADPAPIVINNTVYIISGEDTADPTEDDFVMPEWQIFEATNPDPSGGSWILHRDIADPQTLFSWAAAGTAYASQIVSGPDGRYYLYAPVTQADTNSSDPFGIGVAVSDSVLGPYTDAHPSGPIISQTEPPPGDDIENIDPTVLVDDDGSVYIYFGTFGVLMGYELESDMVTPTGSAVTIDILTGYFEAPWLMKRDGTYYLLYAGNNAGPDSPCTPTLYHACIAYGTASSPFNPWTYQGIVLNIVSSTTSHPGVFEMDGEYYLVYHNRDAVGGTHFRRSIAFDKMGWDDSTDPPSIITVTQTHRPSPPSTPTRNIAPNASPSSANGTPVQYWIASLNDGWIPPNPLPPDYWCSWDDTESPETNTLTYTWNTTVELNGVAMSFFADHDAGADVGVPPPAFWYIEYLTSSGSWEAVDVTDSDQYPTAATDTPPIVNFTTVSTTALRAILTASGGNDTFGGVGIKEWEALAPTAQ